MTADEERTVLEAVRDAIDIDELHGLATTRRSGETWYLVAAHSTTLEALDDGPDSTLPVLDLRTVVVDLETDSVTPTDNGLWVPRDSGDVAESLTRLLARSTSDLENGEPVGDPATPSAVDGMEPSWLLEKTVTVDDAEDIEGQHVEKMKRHTGVSPARSWGYGAGPPPEVDDVVERLEAAGLDPADHLSRLVWGKKEPMDRVTRPLEELVGNYGIELQPREVGLVALDVDYPEAFPEEAEAALPETLEISSPHGDDERRHIVLRCDEKDRVAEELGAWAVQSVEWGDLWIGDRYLVGPGSQLSEYGCDHGPHDRGDAGGCPTCEDPDRGYYRVVRDAPIAPVSGETVLELVPDDGEGELRDEQAAPDAPGEPAVLECHNCGSEYDVEQAAEALESVEVAGETYRKCREGCYG
jgi:hypothetical protein